MNRDPEAGFSMIEALVAMAVLAVGAVSLLGATEGHSVRIGDLTERTAARWVAEERLAALRLGLPGDERPDAMFGRDWRVTVTRETTSDASLDRVEIDVTPADADGANVTVTGYVDAGRNG